MFDRWWFHWTALFPELPYWNPYVACLIAFAAIRLAIRLFHIVDVKLWRIPNREILPPE